MRRQAMLVGWLLTTGITGVGSAAAPNSAERKPVAASKGAPVKSALDGKPRAIKPLPRHAAEVGHRPVITPNVSPAPRPAVPVSSAPRLDRTATGAAPRPSIEGRIAAAREVYQAGRYAEVPTALIKLLTESQLTPSQLAVVYELLASAYVALGQTDLAIRCFGEVLSRRPAFALDPVRTSPKIRAALDQAQAQVRPAAIGAVPATRRPM